MPGKGKSSGIELDIAKHLFMSDIFTMLKKLFPSLDYERYLDVAEQVTEEWWETHWPAPTTMPKEEQPQGKIERSTQPERVRAGVKAAVEASLVRGRGIFDLLTDMRGQLQEIDRKLQLQTDFVQELRETRAERERLLDRASELEQKLQKAEAERDRLQREKEAERERQEQEAQAKLDHQRTKANERSKRYREARGEEGLRHHAAYQRERRARKRENPS